MPQDPSTLQEAIDRLLGDEDLKTFVRSRRARKVSWRRIERELFSITGVGVTFESLRSWFPDPADKKKAVV